MYIAVKGGQAAIAAADALRQAARRGDPAVPELGVDQVQGQLRLLVDRVMAEASLYDPELAALALKQAAGDAVEAVFLLRAFRTTFPRWGNSLPLDTRRMRVQRRVSAIFKDLPGGQLLGPTVDYTQRLLDFRLLAAGTALPPLSKPNADNERPADPQAALPNPLDLLAAQGLIEPCLPSAGDPEPPDITRDPPAYPLPRSARLQMLARADEGWVLGMGYATQRGHAYSHPFAGEIRLGAVPLEIVPDELGFAIEIGELQLTDCQMVTQFDGSAEVAPQFTRGQGLVFGHGERKAMAMALVDRALRVDEFGTVPTSATQDQEFVLPQGDNVEASGFVQHLKLPHYVTFESELQLVRALRQRHDQAQTPTQAQPPVDGETAP